MLKIIGKKCKSSTLKLEIHVYIHFYLNKVIRQYSGCKIKYKKIDCEWNKNFKRVKTHQTTEVWHIIFKYSILNKKSQV